MQNSQGRYPVCVETPYVNQFVVQLSNENLRASSFDEGKFGFPDVSTNTIAWCAG